MRKLLLSLVLLLTVLTFAQDIVSLKEIQPHEEYENILVKPYFSDQHQSSYIIWIKKEVRLHKHEHHTENIYVIEGKGEMTIGDEKFVIKKGDFFTIPENTPHALIVHSSKPVKVLSIQSPKFEGKDRIFLDEE